MNIIVNGITLNLDNPICEKFADRLYPVTPKECEMYIVEEYKMPAKEAIFKYGIDTVTDMLNMTLKLESEI